MWRLYLVTSCASFRTGSCQLYQIVFSRQGNDAIPWSRDDLDLPGSADLDLELEPARAAP
jgi:hypothetical protein